MLKYMKQKMSERKGKWIFNTLLSMINRTSMQGSKDTEGMNAFYVLHIIDIYTLLHTIAD
jgi:hypothetical protein